MVALIRASGGTGKNIMNANYIASSGLHETVSKDKTKTKREDDLIFKWAMEEKRHPLWFTAVSQVVCHSEKPEEVETTPLGMRYKNIWHRQAETVLSSTDHGAHALAREWHQKWDTTRHFRFNYINSRLDNSKGGSSKEACAHFWHNKMFSNGQP